MLVNKSLIADNLIDFVFFQNSQVKFWLKIMKNSLNDVIVDAINDYEIINRYGNINEWQFRDYYQPEEAILLSTNFLISG